MDQATENADAQDGPVETVLTIWNASQKPYHSLCVGFNLRFPGTPQHIVTCSQQDDVVEALNTFKDKRIQVRGGGHCYEGFVTEGVDIIIDISQMKQFHIYPDLPNMIGVETGNDNWDLYCYLFKMFGTTIPAGSCYSVGLGGHIVGGGYGLMSRVDGLTVDYLCGVTLAHWDENEGKYVKKRYIDDSTPIEPTNPETFDYSVVWGHKGGGGGNWGIITEYFFHKLPAAPEKAFIQNLMYSYEQLGLYPEKVIDGVNTFPDGTQMRAFAYIMTRYGEFFHAHGKTYDPGDKYNNMYTFMLINHKSSPGQMSFMIYYASRTVEGHTTTYEEAQADINEFLAFIDPYNGGYNIGPYNPPSETLCACLQAPHGHSDLREYPWMSATMTLNQSGPNRFFKTKSSYMRTTFTQHECETIWDMMTTDHNAEYLGSCYLQVDSYGGKINEVKPWETAVPQRDSIMKLQWQAYWEEPKLTPEPPDDNKAPEVLEPPNSLACQEWVNEWYAKVYKEYGGEPNPLLPAPGGNDHVDGCYYNYPDTRLTRDTYAYLYWKENYPHLQNIKKQLDPLNKFYHAQSIQLPDCD